MNPVAGILLIAFGSIGATSFSVPFKKVKSWAWESFWISQGLFAWIIIPWIFAYIFIPKGELIPIIGEAPMKAKLMAMFFCVLWGFGGLTFGLALRYLGVAFGQSIALSLCAAFGTLLPPIIAGDNLFTPAGILIINGVAITIAGIIIIGYAGSLMSKEMTEEQKKAVIFGTDENKTFGALWDYYCMKENVPVGQDYIEEIVKYETGVLNKR